MKRSFRRTLPVTAAFIAAAGAVACGLSGGSIDVLAGSDDASPGAGDAASDAVSSSDGNVSGDATTTGDAGLTDADAAVLPRYIYANTTTKAYSLEVHSNVLREIGSVSTCTDAAITTFDLAQDSLGVLHVVTWKSSGSFGVYAIEADAACVDVHGGPGSNPSGPSMWVGFQKGASSDTLYSVIDNNGTLFSYNGNGDYITSVNSVFSGGGATADIACTSALCYTALVHDRCPTPTAGNDCLVSLQSSGTGETQLGDFGKVGITGIAYDEGFVYGFASDGSISKISVTAPSTGSPVAVTGVSTSGLVWQGAASSSANE